MNDVRRDVELADFSSEFCSSSFCISLHLFEVADVKELRKISEIYSCIDTSYLLKISENQYTYNTRTKSQQKRIRLVELIIPAN